MKNCLRIVSLLLAAVLFLGVLVGCASPTQPLTYLKEAVKNTLRQRFGGEAFDRLDEVLGGGSVSLSFGGTDLFEAPVEQAELKAYFNTKDKTFQIGGNLYLGGERFDAALWLNETELALSSTAFLGSNTLGIDFTTLAADIKNSIFRNDSHTDYAQSGIDGDTAAELKALKEGLFDLFATLGDMGRLSDDILEIFLNILAEQAVTEVYSKNGLVHISLEVNNSVLSRSLRLTRRAIADNRRICNELRGYAELLDKIATAKTGVVTTARADALEKFFTSDADTERLCALIDAGLPFALPISASVARGARMIEALSLSLRAGGADIFAFTADLSEKNLNVLSLTTGDVSRKLTYRVTENRLFTYAAEVAYTKATAEGELFTRRAEFSSDKRDDAFTLSLDTATGKRVFTGFFDEELTGYRFSVDSVTENGRTARFALAVEIREDDPVPPLPDTVNLFAITESRFSAIDARVREKVALWQSLCEGRELDAQALFAFLLNTVGLAEELE